MESRLGVKEDILDQMIDSARGDVSSWVFTIHGDGLFEKVGQHKGHDVFCHKLVEEGAAYFSPRYLWCED